VFARKTDDGLTSFVKALDDMVGKYTDKKAKGTVILLGAKDDFAAKLGTIAKDQKLQNVPLTVAKDGAKGPRPYSISKDAPVTVVVYDDGKKVTATFTYDTLDAKAQAEVLAAFAKVLGVEAPKAAETPAAKPDDRDDKKEDPKGGEKKPD
jgi:hypothetical protein